MKRLKTAAPAPPAPAPVELDAAQAQELAEAARQLLLGLKVLQALARRGDQQAASILAEYRRILRSPLLD